jgi:uncharacterized protein (DUF1919 family)
LINNGLERVYLKDILKMINKKDIRTVGKWCKSNDVPVYQDCSGKYVIESEFHFAYNKPVVEEYIKKYGKDWIKFYERAGNGNLHLSLAEESQVSSKNRYQPKSVWSQEILGSIKK